MTANEDFYEDDTLEISFIEHSEKGAEDFIHDPVEDVKKFTGSAPQNDDITALFLKRFK